jgi:ubiquinone biosynthesis protein
MIAASDWVAISFWILLGVPGALLVTFIGGRLLGARRGWVSLLVSGIIGWTMGLIIAGHVTSWDWGAVRMVSLTIVFGSLFTMLWALALDFIAVQGTLAKGDAAGLVTVSNPVARMRATAAPARRYREVVRIARANGVIGQHVDTLSLPEGARRTIEQAGGIFVKLGQVASTRADLLPAAWCDELSKLRSSAQPAPESVMRPHVEAQLGRPVSEVYASFDWTPIASASIAQVYAATLLDGREVVVKVQRPGLDDIVATDTAAIMSIATLIEHRTPIGSSMKPTDLAKEFLDGVREELDFRVEVRNALDLTAAVARFDGVRVPTIHADLSSRMLLTEERVKGRPVTDAEWVTACGQDISTMADRLIEVFLHQMFVAGVFHADPHPGNLLMEEDGTIVLIDLGAVGRLGPAYRSAVMSMLMAASMGDAQLLRTSLTEVIRVDTRVDLGELDFAIQQFFDRHFVPGKGITTSAFADLTTIVGGFGLRLPDWFGTLTRTMITLEGTLKGIDPEFALVDAGRRFGESYVKDRTGIAGLKDTLEKEAMAQLPRLRRIPNQVSEILEQASGGRLSAKVSFLSDERDQALLTKLVDRVVFAVLAAALGIGSVFLIGIENGPDLTATVTLNEFIGYVGLGASALLAMRVVANVIRDGQM